MFGWILGVLEEPSRPPNMEEIYLEYKKLMYATARKFTSNVEDQKDIVQTAMERLIKFFSVPRPEKRCISGGYIVFTIRNVAIDFLRKQDREAEHCISIEDGQLKNIAADSSLDEQLPSLNSADQLWSIWSQLPPEDRILLEGKHILGYTNEEIAMVLDCKASSVRMKLTRARRRAAKLLSERNEL